MQTQPYPIMPQALHDEWARCSFVQSFKFHLAQKVRPGNRDAFEREVVPTFKKTTGRAPGDRHEVRRAMLQNEHYRMWGTLQRTSQEMLWHSALDTVERESGRVIAVAQHPARTRGSLTLKKGLKAPRYIADVDIHAMPGSYCGDASDEDVSTGAIFDYGVQWYTSPYVAGLGGRGSLGTNRGAHMAAFLRTIYPDLKPKRILDIGCTVGHSTIAIQDAFPQAEVHAIDAGAGMLRYAHARASELGRPIHFAQQDAEAMDFPDGHFDLIVSHILLHEVSRKATQRIMKECHRLLTPGGVCAHQDVSLFAGMSPFDAFEADWDTYNNNEPCWGQMRETDGIALMAGAGFARDRVRQTWVPHGTHEFRDTPVGNATYTLSARK
jgi:2-polyprenyl-3-methyl-5-hydroxy-6-metoxy-1,4-benzoquinol methylase